MAKSKKLGYSEVNDLSQMSMEDLQSRFYALAQRAEQRQQPAANGQAAENPAALQQKVNTGFASLDLGDTPYSPDDFQSLTIEQLEEKYLDPALLETRPEYANGSSPEKAIMKTPEGATWQRTKLAFSNKPITEQIKYLEEEYGAGNVKLSKGKNITVKQNGAWFQLDPAGGGQGDLMDRALERTRDVLADNADLAVSLGLGVATAGAAAPLVAGLTGAAAIGGAAGVGAASGAGSAMGRVLMGRLVGTYDANPEDTLKDIGVETLISMAGGSFVPGAKYGAKEFGKMFAKAQPALQKAAPGVKDTIQKILGFTSGAGEDAVSHWMDNPKVPTFLARYADDAEGALLANIDDTKAIARNVVDAKRNFGQDIYGKFAEEAGEDFAPWVGKIFTGSNTANAKNPITLMDEGVLKYNNGALSLNVADDVTSIFGRKESLRVLKPLVDVVNDFNKARPATGKDGAKQYLVFKERLNDALAKAEAAALAPGRSDLQALSAARNLKAELMTAYAEKAVDAVKAPQLAGKLANVDKEWARISTLTDEFESAVRKGGEFDVQPYRQLYEKVFAQNKISSKSAANKSEINQIMDILGKYKPDISNLTDNIGARKAAIAASPWMRTGMAANVQTTAGMATGLATNPTIGGFTFAAGSPKINYKAAQLASGMFKGLDFIRGLAPEARKQMLQTPQAVQQFYKTILEIPGIEAQTANQLNQMLRGGSGGQQ